MTFLSNISMTELADLNRRLPGVVRKIRRGYSAERIADLEGVPVAVVRVMKQSGVW